MATTKPYGDTTYTYGDSNRLWGTNDRRFDYYVVLKTVNGATSNDFVVRRLDKEIVRATWEFRRYGGCGNATIVIREPFEEIGQIDANYAIEIWINELKQNVYHKVYEGMVVSKAPNFKEPDTVTVTCQGFSVQLNRIIIGAYGEYVQTDRAVGWIVDDIISNYVVGKTDIQYTAWGDNPVALTVSGACDYVPLYINFTQSAWDCISYLADIQGNVEWGVDRNREFYFIPSSETIKHYFWYGKNVSSYRETISYEHLVNRVWIKDKYFSTTFERSTDLAVSHSYTTGGSPAIVGTNKHWKLRQKFTTDKRSISRIQLKVRRYPDAYYSGHGFNNYIVNGNFESDSITPWQAKGTGTLAELNTNLGVFGNNCIRIRTALPDAGIYQTISNVPEGNYTLRFYYLITRGDFHVKVYTVDGGVESTDPIATSDRYKDKSEGNDFTHEFDFSFKLEGTHDAIRIYFVSQIKFVADWYLDGITLFANSSALKFNLINYDTGDILAQKLVNESYSISELPVGADSDNLFNLDVHYYGCNHDGITNYALYIERDGGVTDQSYFVFERDSSGDNTLQYLDNETTFEWTNYGKLWFKVYYNQSQEKYGLHEENKSNPPTTDRGLVQLWVDGYLSGKDRPFVKADFQVNALREVLEKDTIPLMSLGRVAFCSPSGVPLPKQDTDNGSWKYMCSDRVSAQSFKHPYNLRISSITLVNERVGSPTGNVWVEIREDIGGIYSSTAIENGVSDYVDASTISTTKGKQTYTFSTPPLIEANKSYFIYCIGDFPRDASNYIAVYRNSSGDAYEDGYFIYYNGADYDYDNGADLRFEISGKEEVKDLDLQLINYSLGENGLNARIQSGEPLPDLAVYLKRLELRIKNLSSMW